MSKLFVNTKPRSLLDPVNLQEGIFTVYLEIKEK